jgi:hypothetical protein
MSVSTANICPAILTSLFAQGIQSPGRINAKAGTLGALLSAENLAFAPDIKQAFNDGGHTRTVRITHKQRTIESDASDEKSCGGGPENPYLENEFDVTTYKEIKWKVSEATVRRFCREYSEIQTIPGFSAAQSPIQTNLNLINSFGAIREMAQEFMFQAPGLVDAINLELQNQFALVLGDYANSNDESKTFVVQNSDANGGGPLFTGLSQFYQELDKIGWTGTPHVIGSFGALGRLIGMGGTAYCCSQLGINFEQIMTDVRFRYFSDRYVSTVQSSDDAAIVFYPGSANFIQYLQYDNGNLGGKIDNIYRMSIPMPGIPNMMVDLRIVENGCDEDYDFIMGTYFDLYAAPEDMYKSGDWLAGVNGIVKAVFSQAA